MNKVKNMEYVSIFNYYLKILSLFMYGFDIQN